MPCQRLRASAAKATSSHALRDRLPTCLRRLQAPVTRPPRREHLFHCVKRQRTTVSEIRSRAFDYLPELRMAAQGMRNGEPVLVLPPAVAVALERFDPQFRPRRLKDYPPSMWRQPCRPAPDCTRSLYRPDVREAPFAVVGISTEIGYLMLLLTAII